MEIRNRFIYLIAVAALILGGFLGSLNYTAPATAAPAAIPTPASINRGDGVWAADFYFRNTALTTDRRSQCIETGAFDVMDVQYNIDQGASPVNTNTIKLQYTNDLQYFTDGVALVTANTADASNLVQLPVFGRYTCIYFDGTGSRPVTVTVSYLLK